MNNLPQLIVEEGLTKTVATKLARTEKICPLLDDQGALKKYFIE
jgi:hypothetical protein